MDPRIPGDDRVNMEERIKDNLKNAQLSRDEVSVSTLRLLLSEITNTRIQKGEDLKDEDIISVVQREIKKRKESAEAFRNGGRVESAQKEEAEMKILQDYLPAQLSTEELTKIVEDTINELGANSPADMGKVIGAVMGKVGQSAEGSSVSAIVKEHLVGNR